MNFKVFSLFTLISIASAIAQNNQGGTLVTAPIRPFAVQDTFPTAWANEIKGGPFTSTNLTGLSNIPVSRLEIGSLGYAQDTGLFHRLTSISPVIWSPIDGSNFTNLPISATNISGILPISLGGTEATTASGARTNLGLGAPWLTNTSETMFRTAIGLGTTNTVSFAGVNIGQSTITYGGNSPDAFRISVSSTELVVATTNIFSFSVPVSSPKFSVGSAGNSVSISNTEILFTGVAAASTRTNLGLGWSALTNTDSTNFRTAIGLGETNEPIFRHVYTDGFVVNGTNPYSIYTNSTVSLSGYDGLKFFDPVGETGVADKLAATTRTNLGLGATWLTNTNSPPFNVSAPSATNSTGLPGEIAITTNYLYICVGTNTWKRVPLASW